MWLVDQLYIKLGAEGPGSETLSCEDHNLIRGNLQLLCYIAKEHDHPNIITTDMAIFSVTIFSQSSINYNHLKNEK